MRQILCYAVMACLAAAVVNEAVKAYFGNDAAQYHSQLTAGDYRGHEYVDLELPSRLKWATCNIGADKPWEAGNYYSWGETAPKAGYSSHRYEDGSGMLTKYNIKEKCGAADGRLTLSLGDDAAHRAWGGSWRMPTPAEAEELWRYCQLTDTIVGGQSVTKVTGRNGRHILLPHAGHITGRDIRERNKTAYIWTSTAYSNDCRLAVALSTICSSSPFLHRSMGLSVRAVAR